MRSALKRPQDREGEIHQALVFELVELTPETWDVVVLEVDFGGNEEGPPDLEYRLSSPQSDRPDQVELTEKVYNLTQALFLLYEEHRATWTRARYEIHVGPSGEIDFDADFTYQARK